MFVLPRRWRSIDRKLPLLASGLVLLTSAVLAWTAYAMLERALLDTAERRMASGARAVASMIARPTVRIEESPHLTALRDFASGRVAGSPVAALAALDAEGRDFTRPYVALYDAAGHVLLEHRTTSSRPRWPAAAIALGEIRGDTLSTGAFERLDSIITYSVAYPIRSRAGDSVIAYAVHSRALPSSTVMPLRQMLGDDVSLFIGEHDLGIWTDFDREVAEPPSHDATDGPLILPTSVGAIAQVPGARWVVWVAQPHDAVFAPARRLLWIVVLLGTLLAVLGAAVVWRVAHRIASPIVTLTDVAEGVARDTHSLPDTDEMPVHVAGGDEVARLRFAVERMAERITEREHLEEQLRHAQKMEAVGRLAGGVAHDFNNLLTAIRSYADLMLDDMPAWDPKRSDVQEIRTAAQRAAALTAQLLAFSRKSMLQPRVLETRSVMVNIHDMLRRLLVEDIRLEMQAPQELWAVKADRGQLEQVIVNLAVNARDAMPNGGALRISAANETIAEALETPYDIVPAGEYVSLRVADTGMGMDALARSRAFEPFFTTKGVGQGTGLGLATVHGIVAQSGGYVTLSSEVGLGSTFTVYLPRALEQPAPDAVNAPGRRAGNKETILLVEDEQAVRTLARRVLVRAGFRVLESTTPSDALRLARAHAAEITLVLSDVVMPEMSGPALVTRIAELIPSARVLYISGYTDDEIIGRGLANPGVALLQKPFSAQQLVERVRSAIDDL
ncbi:MAG: ATP-binding protein [Gemmatimonadaceae bacterium]